MKKTAFKEQVSKNGGFIFQLSSSWGRPKIVKDQAKTVFFHSQRLPVKTPALQIYCIDLFLISYNFMACCLRKWEKEIKGHLSVKKKLFHLKKVFVVNRGLSSRSGPSNFCNKTICLD